MAEIPKTIKLESGEEIELDENIRGILEKMPMLGLRIYDFPDGFKIGVTTRLPDTPQNIFEVIKVRSQAATLDRNSLGWDDKPLEVRRHGWHE